MQIMDFEYLALQTNTFQGIVTTDFNTSYAVFIYRCREMGYSASATIGFTSADVLFENHRLSGYGAKNIACINSGDSQWVNIVYQLTREDLQPTTPTGTCLYTCLYVYVTHKPPLPRNF